MIKNPSFAIGWLMLKSNQKSSVFLVASIPLMLLIKLIFGDFLPPDNSFSAYKLYAFLLVFITILITMIFTFAELSGDLGTFPRHTFTHPISSFQLAIIPISLGILMAYFYYICWSIFVVEYQMEAYQYLIIFCCVSAGVSWLQMVSWRYNKAPFVSITLLIAIVAVIFVLFVSSWDLNNLKPLVNKNLAYLGLILLPLSGILLAINSVTRCRTNQTKKQNRFLSNVGFIGFKLPQSYNSISQALFRYEWRVFGWKLPMPGVFIVFILIYIVSNKGVNEQFLDMIAIISIPLIFVPWLAQVEMAKPELSLKKGKANGLSSFFTSLPISNFELAMAKLKLLSRSIGLLHLMVLLTINIILVLFGDNLFVSPWRFLESHFGIFKGGLILLGINLMYPIVTWALAGNILNWCLKGVSFFTARIILISFFGLLLISLFGFMLYSTEFFRTLLKDYFPLFNGLVFIIIATTFYRALEKFRSVESLKAIMPVFITALSLLVFELYVFSALELITLSYPHAILILLDFTLLGILPFLTSPLSVAMNRAR